VPERDRPLLSVVVPVYNEESTVLEVIARVRRLETPLEVVVVDDGSTDSTAERLREVAGDEGVTVLRHAANRGKGAALRTGFAQARGEIVAVLDADLEYDPVDLGALMQPILDGVADAVYGSRLSGGRPQRVFMFWHLVGNRFLTLVTNVLFNTTLSDMETGYKVLRREVLDGIRIRSDDFTVEPELTAKLLKRGVRLYELPVAYYGRTYAEGKKVTWRHGVTAFLALVRYRFTD
jgi:glycosyltransferase involved in cell wall biosynthesis